MRTSVAQLFALGLAASNTAAGFLTTGNTGLARRAAGHAVVAFAAPALAAPIDTVDLINRAMIAIRDAPKVNGSDPAAGDLEDCDGEDDAGDDADDAEDDVDDAADDADDDADDAADDADDAADDADDEKDD